MYDNSVYYAEQLTSKIQNLTQNILQNVDWKLSDASFSMFFQIWN